MNTIDYLIATGEKLYTDYKKELDTVSQRYGMESAQAQALIKKLARITQQMDKLTCIDTIS